MKGVVFKLAAALALAGGLGVSASADEKLACSLSVSPMKADSSVKRTGGGNGGRGSSSSTTTFERNLKYKAVASFRGPTPDKPVLKVWYVGTGDGGKEMIEVGKAEHPLELDEKGRVTVELVSPTTKMTKTKTTTQFGGRNSGGGGTTKSTTTGERVTGCVIQVFAGGALMKSWVSDSRWSKAARDPSFSFEMIDPKSAAKRK